MLEQIESPGGIGPKEKAETVEVVKISAFKKGMAELERLYIAQQEAGKDYSTAVNAAAEKSGLKPAVIRKAVKAKVEDNLDDVRYEAEQLLLALD